ncbi:MAG: nucleotide sugar dehydrogenase [Acidobacteriaceae bacterium]
MTGATTSSNSLPQPASDLLARIADRSARVGIVGMGYVGLPLALLFSEQGFRVTGFDVDPVKVAALSSGNSYIVRIPSTEIQAARTRGFSATSDYAAVSAMDAVIICVPTPLTEFHEPDLSFITGTASAIAPHLRPHQLIVLESTTYPGTTDELLIPLLNQGNPAGLRAESTEPTTASQAPGFYVAFSPEREDPGNDTVARRDIPKVIGAAGPVSRQLACALYGGIFNRTVPVSSPAAAEMTKLLENIYRCVNIALVNELKQLCARMDIDLFEVIDAAKTKPFGFQAFYPGPGLGGHCIPIDPFYLSWKAKEFDFRTRFIELAGEINTKMPYYVVEKTGEALNHRRKPLQGSKILILGVAYKKDIDDLRESPALTIIELLRRRGATVAYNDPYFARVGRGRHYDLNMTCTPLDNLSAYDAVLIVTDHSSYDIPRIVGESQLVVDTRNATKGLTSPNIVRC